MTKCTVFSIVLVGLWLNACADLTSNLQQQEKRTANNFSMLSTITPAQMQKHLEMQNTNIQDIVTSQKPKANADKIESKPKEQPAKISSPKPKNNAIENQANSITQKATKIPTEPLAQETASKDTPIKDTDKNTKDSLTQEPKETLLTQQDDNLANENMLDYIQLNEKNIDTSQEGVYRLFNKRGMLIYEAHYKGGVLHGVARIYDVENGTLKSEMVFANGLQDGEMKIYDTQGNLWHKLHYKQGKKHGLAQEFNANGTIINETQYENNKEIK